MDNEQIFKGALELIERGHTVRITIKGISMTPFLFSGRDDVLFAKIEGVPKKYDIVLFQRTNGKYVMHRIMSLRNGIYKMMGDGEWQTEEVRPERLRAIATGFTRKGREWKTTDFWYRAYVFIWCHMIFIRRPLLNLYFRVGKILSSKER